MTVYLLRHGATEANLAGRYQGRQDAPLSRAGRAALRRLNVPVERVYVSPLRRAAESAALFFPAAEQIAVPELREMDFGPFEGHTWQELSGDADYRAWLDSGCEAPIPGGEGKAAFCARVCAAFAALLERETAAGAETVALVAHGGTLMAALERFARPHRAYFDWHVPPGGGFALEAEDWREKQILKVIKELKHTNGD